MKFDLLQILSHCSPFPTDDLAKADNKVDNLESCDVAGQRAILTSS